MSTSNYADVLRRVRAYATADQFTSSDVWHVRWDLARETPGSTDLASNALRQQYVDQVLRALYALVKEGVLVKVNSGRDARYWRPAALERRQQEAREAGRAHAAKVEKYRQLKLELAGAGFINISSSQLDIRLSLEDWERFIDTYLRDDGGS